MQPASRRNSIAGSPLDVVLRRFLTSLSESYKSLKFYASPCSPLIMYTLKVKHCWSISVSSSCFYWQFILRLSSNEARRAQAQAALYINIHEA